VAGSDDVTGRRRLDAEMVRRGLAGTRSEAALAIRAGKVRVAGRPTAKTGTLVAPSEAIGMAGPARRYVSRGGDKLEAALDRFGILVEGRVALDAGASTGGFTDCLLRRGVRLVIAVDVGYGQLDWRLRQDRRVTVMERRNVRSLRPDELPARPGLVTADLSFVPLRLALPALVACAAVRADMVLLVKPQFEVGRDRVRRGGVVSDPHAWNDAIHAVAEAAAASGFPPLSVMASPVVGPAGNVEFLLHAARPSDPGTGLEGAVHDALDDGLALREKRSSDDEGEHRADG
jgi:23S rRNA (cytidine1920-2'-O)/16S rRNA (cytidine1409-2'-O)-methyltransferase